MGALLSCLRADADVEERYVPVKRVGSGAEATVWLARERSTGGMYALKLVKRGMASWQARTAPRELPARARPARRRRDVLSRVQRCSKSLA